MTRGTAGRAGPRGPLRRSDQGTDAEPATARDGREHGRHEHGRHEHGNEHGSEHGQAHDHDHAAVAADADRRYISGALGLILAFMAAEVVVGIAARSLALISDAGHMLTDAAALALALAAMRLAARPAQGRWTFGFKRAEILSAQANGITLLVLVAVFTYEAVRRLVTPPDVRGGLVIATALAGIAVNAAAAWLVGRANRTSLNVEGAFQHILNDAWAFIATAAAGVVVLTTGFARADALASLVVAALMARAGFKLVRESWRIFLEAAPEGLEPVAIGTAMAADPEISEVHDLHVWTITSGFPALSAHVLVTPGHDCHAVRGRLQRLLREEYGIEHTTLQVDHAPEPLLTIGRAASVGEAEHSRPQNGRPRDGAAQDRDEPEAGPGAQQGAH